MELSTENLKNISQELQDITTALKALEASGDKLIIGIEDIMEMTGWSRETVRQFMHRPDFPLIKIGRDLQVNKIAFVHYTMQRLA